MAGKKTDKDLFSDFFGDDDLGWLDEEAEAKAAAEQAAAAAAAEEAGATGAEAAPAEPADDQPEQPVQASEPSPAEAPTQPDAKPFTPPPPPPPVPRGTGPGQKPLMELTPVPSAAVTRPRASMPDTDPEETLIAAPVADGGAQFDGGPVALDAFERDPMDETIGAFLEPLDGGADPEALETVTDATPTRPLADIVVEEDAPEEIAAPAGPKASPAPARLRLMGGIERVPTDEVATDALSGEDGLPDDELAETLSDKPKAPPTPRRPWTPRDERGRWKDAVTVIEAAAQEASGAEQAALLLEAARIRRDRIGDLPGAVALINAATSVGGSGPDIEELRAETASRAEDPQTAADALAVRAGQLDGPAAAEAWQAAAMLARHRLNAPEVAEQQLREAVAADPNDYASLSLLRDQLSEKGRERERAEVLGKISAVATGRVAAEAWWELGRLHHRLGEEEQARAAYRSGRDADPSHGPCFLALQALAVAAADDAALGELYLEEAHREGQNEGAWWLLEAARAFVDGDDHDRAGAAFAAAVEAGHPFARREQQAWALSREDNDAYLASMAAELEADPDSTARPFTLYRYGRALEAKGEFSEAVTAFREVVSLDPAAGPAAEATARAQQGAGQHEELLAFWEERLAGTEDQDLKRSLLLRMAETADAGLKDAARTRGYLERLLEDTPDHLPALHLGRRIYQRLGAWTDLAQTYERLATLETVGSSQAQHYARAGNVWRYRVEDKDQAREAYGKALALQPDHLIALDEQVDLLEDLGDHQAQAEVLRSAADAVSSDADKVRLAYHAGQVWLDALGDTERAGEAFRHCLRFDPDFLPALSRLKEVAARTGEGAETYRLYLQQAQGLDDPAARHWRLLAAADLASDLNGGDPSRDLGAILEQDPAHPGALAAQELRMLAIGAKVGLLNLYRQALHGAAEGPDRASLLVRIAHLFESLGDASGVQGPLAEAVETGDESTPFRALARLAEGQRLWPEAATALQKSGSHNDRLERARLLAQRLGRHDEALEIYESLLSEEQAAVGAALGAAALAQKVGRPELLLQAHATLAERGESESVRAAHALWSAQLAEAAGKHDESLRLYRLALDLRPTSATAFEGARRLLADKADSDGLSEIWKTYRPADLHGRALDLERTGELQGVVALWEQEVASRPEDVSALVRLEQARTAVEDWPGVYATVSRRAALVTDPEVRATTDAKRRWLLANKLSDTDDAWELYRGLHEESPEDRDVLSALAGIALARGETRVAIGYLETLAEGATDPGEAAQLRVRTAEVHRAADATDDARQAYLDALDHRPSHQPALDGLKELATEAKDWPGLLAILQREAGLFEGEAKVASLVNIAETTASHLGDPKLTMDAWRAVLEVDPDHVPSLTALVALSRSEKDWPGFVQQGSTLAELLDGSEKTALLAQIGVISADQLGRDDGPEFWERAITEGPANLEAADRLEAHYRSKRDGSNAVRVLTIHADAVDDPKERGRLLADAAELELEGRADRDEVARIYQRAVEADPDESRALRFLTEHLYSAARYGEALPLFERLAPTVEDGQDLDDFDVCMEMSSFYYRLAKLQVDAGRGDEALPNAKKALKFNPQHQPTLQVVAPLYVANENWKEANAALKKLLQLTGGQGDKATMADIYAQLGEVERALGVPKKASRHFAKALDLMPKHPRALRGMARLFEDEENWSSALDRYNDIIINSKSPEDVTAAYLVKGRILDERLNRPDKAAQHYMKSIAYDANQPQVLIRLAELSLRRDDVEEAVGAARRGLELVSSGTLRADLLACEAVARLRQGDAKRAEAALGEAREVAPDGGFPGSLDDPEAALAPVRQRLG